jgi:exportin-2 (importin alpha re-exporter)
LCLLIEVSTSHLATLASVDVNQIQLMLGIAVRKESSQGVSETNRDVNLMEFFTSQILPDLQDTNHSSRPVVKATALKFVTTFRNQFSSQELSQLFPMIVAQMGSSIVVVHTFAAYSIERILVAKDTATNQVKFGRAELQPFLEPLFMSLFAIVDNVALNENDYVMKCIMRALSVADEDVVPITQHVIEKLTAALERVSKNPRNPQFNHFLFESIAVLVRAVCGQNPNAPGALENLLFPPFQAILQNDILEFSPYVFQILAQLLEFHPTDGGLGRYESLFRPLLTPALWERKGNVPALTRLIQAYLLKAAPHLVQGGFLPGMLGCFQKMVSVPATEGDAFTLLIALTMYVPADAMNPFNGTIFNILLTILRAAKSRSDSKYKRVGTLVIDYFAVFVGKNGATSFMTVLDGIQQGLAVDSITQVWLKTVREDPPKGLQGKTQLVGLTRLLVETPFGNTQLWCATFNSISRLLAAASMVAGTDTADFEDLMIGDVEYDSNFSSLANAKKKVVDPFPDVADPSGFVVQAIQQLYSSNPARLTTLVRESLQEDTELAKGVQSMLEHAGINWL